MTEGVKADADHIPIGRKSAREDTIRKRLTDAIASLASPRNHAPPLP
jgi:hypothetical protein